MGVKTNITLKEVNLLFPSYDFTKLIPTKTGIIDTTYILYTQTKSYILKKYERDIKEKIKQDRELLILLKSKGLNVSTCRDSFESWYIYERLQGAEVSAVKLFTFKNLLDSWQNFTPLHTIKIHLKVLARKMKF